MRRHAQTKAFKTHYIGSIESGRRWAHTGSNRHRQMLHLCACVLWGNWKARRHVAKINFRYMNVSIEIRALHCFCGSQKFLSILHQRSLGTLSMRVLLECMALSATKQLVWRRWEQTDAYAVWWRQHFGLQWTVLRGRPHHIQVRSGIWSESHTTHSPVPNGWSLFLFATRKKKTVDGSKHASIPVIYKRIYVFECKQWLSMLCVLT